MSCNNQPLFFPDGYVLPNPGNSFTGQWLDKRSAASVAITVTLSGATPTGSAHLEASNAVEKPTWGGPGTSPPDVYTIPSSTQSISAAGVTAWDIVSAVRWVRVVYTSSSDVSNLVVHVYANAPYSSP